MSMIFVEENKHYQIDCSNAIWGTDRMHEDYKEIREIPLCDVDWIIENEKYMILVEYKNANVPGAAKPEAFEPETGKNSWVRFESSMTLYIT